MKHAATALLVSLLLGGTLLAQGTLEISINTYPGPSGAGGNHSFYTGGAVTAPNGTLTAAITNVVLTETLRIDVTTVPSPLAVPSGTLNPRRLLIVAAPVDPTGMAGVGLNIPFGPLYVSLDPAAQSMVMPFMEIANSFTNPLDPIFGPALGGPNTVTLNINADFIPFPVLGQTIVFQALAEDTYVAPPADQGPATPALLLSGGVRVRIDAPSNVGFAPTLTALSANSTPETAPGMITLTGTNFLAQSNWILYPPTVRFGTTPVAINSLSVQSDTQILVQVPSLPMGLGTNPPRTFACDLDVSLQNNPLLDPLSAIAVLPGAFTYVTSQNPEFRIANPVVCTTSPPNLGVDPEFPTADGCRIFGTWFLDGLEVTFSQGGAPAPVILDFPILPLVNQANPPATRVLETPPFTAPVFCSGPVSISLRNCDGRTSPTNATLTYRTIDPQVSVSETVTAGQPTFALAPGVATPPVVTGTANLIVVKEGAPSLTLKANPAQITPTGTAGFIAASSPLATAPTVAPASFAPTQVSINFAPDPSGTVAQAGLNATNRSTITGMTTIPVQSNASVFRPGLGIKPLTTANAACVGGNTSTLNVLVQDDLPPSLTGITRDGPQDITIQGANFFSTRPSGSLTQNFGSNAGVPVGIPLSTVQVPVVLLRNLSVGLDTLAPEVTVDSTGQLAVRLPDIPPGLPCITVDVFVINPDGQSSSSMPFTLITPLTRSDALAQGSGPAGLPGVLDAAGLIQIIESTHQWVSGQTQTAPPILAVLNPCPVRDQNRDPMSDRSYTGNNAGAGLPISTQAISYELAFVFNTRNPATDEPVIFRFDEINLPQVLDLTGQPARQLPRFFPFFNGNTSAVTLNPGAGGGAPLSAARYRVILKAVGANISGAFASSPSILFNQNFNWPLYLESPGDVALDGFLNLAGDCFLPEAGLANDRFFAQVRATLPPAGGGQGGWGGVQGNPATIPAINPGVTSQDLRGDPGRAPTHSSLASNVFGGGASGSAPISFTVGSGGSGGHATAGTGGGAGGAIGMAFGNYVNVCSTSSAPCGFPGTPCATTPPPSAGGDDRLIFGFNTDDFGAFGSGTVFSNAAPCTPTSGNPLPDRNLFYGGGGGGGGGGLFSLIGFVAALGGRGGNGGGCLLLISDGTITFADAGAISTAGELGLPGIQQFPSPGAIATSLASPGAGGSGAGGTVFTLTTRTVNFYYNSGNVAANDGLTRPFIDARGARGVSLLPAPTVGQASPPLGIGGSGRVRIAVNASSPTAATFASALEAMFADTLNSPVPNIATPLILPLPTDPSMPGINFPAAAPLPTPSVNGDYYRYPCF